MTATIIYNDNHGAMIDWADDYVEIRWYDSSKDMTAQQFSDWLAGFAGGVEQSKRRNVLVDAVQFQMEMSNMDMEFRDANIIRRYNAAGVKKFAFLMPMGMPAIGALPAPEGPANFPTAYFEARSDALAWLQD